MSNEPAGTSSESAAILDSLKGYITELHEEWATLKELFASGDDTVKLLNDTASALFETIYHVLIRDILLGIARLTDPLKTGNKDNLVLERISQLPEVMADPSLVSASSKILVEINALATPFRDYRNKHLAHLDLPTALKPSGEVIPGIKLQDIDAVLAAFANLFNIVDGPLRDRPVLFEYIMIMGGPKSLIRACADSRTWRSLPLSERTKIFELANKKHEG